MKKRVSIFDPHRENIEKWCKAGMPVREMCNKLGAGYSIQGLYAYIYSRNLRTENMGYASRHNCNKCSFCHEYTNTNNGKGRICSLSWKTIQPMVVYCPVWCELEQKHDKE